VEFAGLSEKVFFYLGGIDENMSEMFFSQV